MILDRVFELRRRLACLVKKSGMIAMWWMANPAPLAAEFEAFLNNRINNDPIDLAVIDG